MAYGQTGSKELSNTVSKLKLFKSLHVTEKVYLQFDKPYYAAGDTSYFKGYVTLGGDHQLSGLSGILHVNLINPASKIIRSIKLRLNGGLGWGDFALPDSLQKGNYRIRAYTQWMRNGDAGSFFDQIVPVGSISNNQVSESNVPGTGIKSKADIQFFPEGGELVTGIRSKIAFKAIGTDGLGINAKGQILDNENKVVASFTSTHLGMGYFNIVPQDGEAYKANVIYADGTQNTVTLPNVRGSGVTMSVNNDSIPVASVRIETNNTYFKENKGKDFTLIINSADHITSIDCKLDDPVLTMDIIKRRLSTGVATITLFSPRGEPLCERLLFVQKSSISSTSI